MSFWLQNPLEIFKIKLLPSFNIVDLLNTLVLYSFLAYMYLLKVKAKINHTLIIFLFVVINIIGLIIGLSLNETNEEDSKILKNSIRTRKSFLI